MSRFRRFETTRHEVSTKGPSLCACGKTSLKMITKSSSGRRSRGEAEVPASMAGDLTEETQAGVQRRARDVPSERSVGRAC